MEGFNFLRVIREIRSLIMHEDLLSLNTSVDLLFDQSLGDLQDICKLQCRFVPQQPSIFQGQLLTVRLDLPEEFPLREPLLHISPAVRHPNIQPSTGKVVVSRLLQRGWGPSHTLGTLLKNLILMLSLSPEHSETAFPSTTNTTQQWNH